MAAHEKLGQQFEQLPMFMRASDLRKQVTGTIDQPKEPVDVVMARKLDESKGGGGQHGHGVYEAIEREGVLNPVQLVHHQDQLVLGEGHHRVAAAADIAERTGKDTWVPVVHTEAPKHRDPLQQPKPGEPMSMAQRFGAINDYIQWSATSSAGQHDVDWSRQATEVRNRKKPKP